jgi:predicted DNA-binding transcriptional regulator AlpA
MTMEGDSQKIIHEVESIIRASPNPRAAARKIVEMKITENARSISVKEFCFMRGVSRKTVYNWLSRGVIQADPSVPRFGHQRIIVR